MGKKKTKNQITGKRNVRLEHIRRRIPTMLQLILSLADGQVTFESEINKLLEKIMRL